MCPDKKLKWFKDHGHTPAQIRDIKKLVLTRWTETYKGDEGTVPAATSAPRARRGKVSVKFNCDFQFKLLFFDSRQNRSGLWQQNLIILQIPTPSLHIWLIP